MNDNSLKREFPREFSIGFATSSYQIEGAWNADGKGENIWDRFTHTQPDKIVGCSSGDIACDSYKKYKDDIHLLHGLGAQVYRFSLSWSRIMPTGFKNKINEKGIEYYNNIINELIENNIEPMVTLFHWDLPQPLQDLGGWPNPALIDYFCDYAEVAFERFGDRVKKWITFNEPYEICYLTYSICKFPPAVKMSGIADYLAGHTILKSHAKVYHLYDDKFRDKQKGEIGITLSTNWMEPKSPDDDDVAVETLMQFKVGWFAHPIFSENGDYPKIFKERIAQKSKEQGFPRSRLPEFDSFWINYIKGTSDFYGFNHYTTYLGSFDTTIKGTDVSPSYETDHGVSTTKDPKWSTGIFWLNVVPWGIRKSLNWVKQQYKNPVIYITENGYGDLEDTLADNRRIFYYHEYLTEILKAIRDDGCSVKIYVAWSLLDNFEWSEGYSTKFGICHVDHTDPSRKRTLKRSGEYFKYILKYRKLPETLDIFMSK